MSYESALHAFADAVRKAGGQSAFAGVVGCTQGNIWQLLKKGSPLPPRYVLKAEAATGVSRHDLRPDLYPVELTQPQVIGAGQSVACDRGPVSHREARS